MRWLHLTDIHLGRPDGSQTAAMKSLTDNVRGVVKGTNVDLVLLTGDLTYSGKGPEYEAVANQLIAPLRGIDELRSAQFIATPGNHDIDCKASLPSPWTYLGTERQSLFFGDSPEARTVREPRARGFAAYVDFLHATNIQGNNPTQRCADTAVFEKDGNKVYFLTVNTAFFSDKHHRDEHETPAPVLALRLELAKLAEDARIFILGHHPIEWFVRQTQEPLRSLLHERCAVYLHGHLHEVSVDQTVKGLRTLGFGATYQASLDSTTPSSYENSFALCQLDRSQLHIGIHSWDNKNGLWRPSTRLPAEFDSPSSLIPDGFVFALPDKRNPVPRPRPAPENPIAIRPPVVERIFAVDGVPQQRWLDLVQRLGLLPLDASVQPGEEQLGHSIFQYSINGQTHRIHCIAGPGHILSAREVEAENTRLDTTALDSITVLSFGEIAEEARNLALKLGNRKALSILTNIEVCRLVRKRLPEALSDHIASLDGALVEVQFLLLDAGIGLLVTDRVRSAWFYAVSSSGTALPESSTEAISLRERRTELQRARYEVPPALGQSDAIPLSSSNGAFNKAQYAARCEQEFSPLRYAPLAAIGIRLDRARLRDVYVPAQADVGDTAQLTAVFRQSIEDILDSLHLDETQRAQVEAELRKGLPSSGTRETGAASGLYQRYSNVIILGDPGSGKTCFVNNEVLAYVQSTANSSDWYSKHLPLYLPLAELSLIFSESNDLVAACAHLLGRRGFPITLSQLQAFMEEGHLAFFFDGLDEIPSLQQRAHLAQALERLLERAAPLGNRFVLTSRPAATEGIDVPKQLVSLQLNGLTDGEIRILTENLLRAQWTADDRIAFPNRAITPSQQAVIDKLIDDCQQSPGLRRISRNPLLLTLLVTTYVNSGPLAAKRHRVYAQAVQTLVTLRNRVAGQRVLSEADLRRRLGYTALAIFRNPRAEVPTRSRVEGLIAEALAYEKGPGDHTEEARAFLRSTAELTGILVIHKGAGTAPETVSFLHHSFLEYYAAIGFLEQSGTAGVGVLAESIRWQEVIGLIAGVLGDQSDVTPLISELLSQRSISDPIICKRLVFAFEAALECDVPPEATQDLLMSTVKDSVRGGPALTDPDLRRELGERLGRLLAATGSTTVRVGLAAGIRDEKPQVAAAYVDLASHASRQVDLGEEVVAAFTSVCGSNDNPLRLAVLSAIERVPALRSQTAYQAIGTALRGSIALKFAACRTIVAVPAVAAQFHNELVACLDDSNSEVAGMAARALLSAGIDTDRSNHGSLAMLERCLARWMRHARAADTKLIALKADRQELDRFLASSVSDERMLGLRLLPWLHREERFIHERIMDVLRDRNRPHEETAAALETYRLCEDALALADVSEQQTVRDLLTSQYRDVRLATIQVLAALPTDAGTVAGLASMLESGGHTEVRECLRALGAHGEHPLAGELVLKHLEQRCGRIVDGSVGNETQQEELRRLLVAAREVEAPAGPGLADKLARVFSDYKVPKEVRREALLTYCRVVDPRSSVVQRLLGILGGKEQVLTSVIGRAVQIFLRHARQRVEWVRAIYELLPSIEASLVERWGRFLAAAANGADDHRLRGIRVALVEVRELILGYSEGAQ